MKRLYTLFAILIALGSFLSAAEAQNAEAQNVEFPDDSLAHKVRQALGLARNAPIPKAALATLTELDVRPTSSITDITGLEHATALTSLNLDRNGIGDITLLAGLTNLTYLNIRYTGIDDISPLSGLTSLERLDLSMNYIENLGVLSNLTALKALSLIENTAFFQTPQGLQDISFLSALTALEYLDLQVNHITDLTPLAGLTQLETLLLGNNPSLSDISTLSGLTTLKHLYLNSTSITDISPLSGLTALEHLHLRLNSINDLSPLSSLTSLELLDLRQNPITDVTPLQALTALRVLCLYHTPELTDFQPLHTLRSAVEAQGITVLDGAADVSGAPEAVQKIIRRLREGNLAIDGMGPVAGYLLIDVDIGEAVAESVAEAQHPITGPWLWMIAPTQANQGGAASTDKASLKTDSQGAVTETWIAKNGATEGDVIGNYTWTLGELPANGDINAMLVNIGMTANTNLNDVSSYALITLDSQTARSNVTMGVSSDDSIKVWLNGKVVHKRAVNRGRGGTPATINGYQDTFQVDLIAGDNLLLVKVSERGGN